MGAVMIFCCYDCKTASYESGDDLYVSPDFEKYEGSQRAMINFLKEHRYHKVSFKSDAHGQISPEDYLEEMKKWYGQIISTAEAKPGVVCEKVFETEAEVRAYVLGCKDGIVEADPDSDDLYATVSEVPSEDE